MYYANLKDKLVKIITRYGVAKDAFLTITCKNIEYVIYSYLVKILFSIEIENSTETSNDIERLLTYLSFENDNLKIHCKINYEATILPEGNLFCIVPNLIQKKEFEEFFNVKLKREKFGTNRYKIVDN